MKAEELLGKVVLVPAKIVNVYGNPSADPRTFSLQVQMKDGQGVTTNIGNLREVPEGMIVDEFLKVGQVPASDDLSLLDGRPLDEDETVDAKLAPLLEIPGIIAQVANILFNAGYESHDDLREATDSDLLKIEGVGPGTVSKIRNFLTP